MEFFADTSNLEDIIELLNAGVISGVTTNPKSCQDINHILETSPKL